MERDFKIEETEISTQKERGGGVVEEEKRGGRGGHGEIGMKLNWKEEGRV